MGDRGQVRIVSEGSPDLYFYTHREASNLPEIVASALERGRSRWNDPEYLSRIIFSEMIKDSVMDLTGFGICGSQHDDVWIVVEVYYDHKTVCVRTINYEEVDFDSSNWRDQVNWDSKWETSSYDLFIAQYAPMPVER
jgi:hypothetical protein